MPTYQIQAQTSLGRTLRASVTIEERKRRNQRESLVDHLAAELANMMDEASDIQWRPEIQSAEKIIDFQSQIL